MEMNTSDFKLILNNLKMEIRDKIKSKNVFDERWLNKVLNVEVDSRTKKSICRDYVEKYGVVQVMENFMRKSNELNALLLEYKNISHNANYTEYNRVYNLVCEKMADVKLMYEILEYTFNYNIIDEHYKHKYNDINNDLNSNQLRLDL